MKNKREIIISNIEKEFLGNTIDLEKNQMNISLKKRLEVNIVFEDTEVLITPKGSLLGIYYISRENSQILENAISRIKSILATENIYPIIITRHA